MSVHVNGADIAGSIVIEVTVSPIFGWWNWRLFVAKPLLWLACKVMRCELEFKQKSDE